MQLLMQFAQTHNGSTKSKLVAIKIGPLKVTCDVIKVPQ